MATPGSTKHIEQLQIWLRAVKDSLNRASNSVAESDLTVWYDLVRRALSRHAAAANQRNLFAALPSELLCRILCFTRTEDCIHIMQSCTLLRFRLLELPQLWAATSANVELYSWHLDGEAERTTAIAKLSRPEPLSCLRAVWKSEQSVALTLLVQDTLPRTQSLRVIVPIWPRTWPQSHPGGYDVYDTHKYVTDVANALIVPAPQLRSFTATFYHPLCPEFMEAAELPSSLFAGEASMLSECTLVNTLLPPAGCLAFANVRRLDWRYDRKELGKAELLSMLNSVPRLEVLKLTIMALSWDEAAQDPPLQRSVRNVHLEGMSDMHNVSSFIMDLGMDRFVLNERLLVPDVAVWDDLASSEFEFEFSTIEVGLQLFEATIRIPSSDRDLLIRCRPSDVIDYFDEILPGMPSVSTLPMLTSLCIHEFFWLPAPEIIAPGVAIPAVSLPSLPALRTLKVLFASCLDYYETEFYDTAGVLHQAELRIWDTPVLETLHLSYYLSQTCQAFRSHWGEPQPFIQPPCCCSETLTISLLDVHAFVERFVTNGHSNPRRLQRLKITGVECIDPDQGVSGMRLLCSLADEVHVSPTSRPENCNAGLDVWAADLESIFRDKLFATSNSG